MQVYLDNNATTGVAKEVYESMIPYLTDRWGNPSSMHSFGGDVAKDVEKARGKVADLIGANPSEIVYTSCGTESDNMAIFGTLDAIQMPSKRHFITTKVEHPAVIASARALQRQGYRVTFLGVDEKGRLNLDELRDSISNETAMLSVMWANNETGVIFPIEEIGQIAKAAGLIFHVDAVQAVGKISIDMRNSTVDLLSMSGHKLHAPKGIGVLYIRRGTRIRPYLHGGHQERGRRGGTENVPYIIGLGVAAEFAKKNAAEENTQVKNLRDRLEKGILKAVPNVLVNGDTENRLPNTSNLSFEYVEGEAILLKLDDLGIAASSGSACSSGSLEPSHVLRAMNIPYTAAHGSIRFSLSTYNTQEEIDYTVKHVPTIIEELRNISPFWRDFVKGKKVEAEKHAGPYIKKEV
jgi:cysteine desulfurase